MAYTLLTEGLALEPDNALLLSLAAWALNYRRAMAGRSWAVSQTSNAI